MKLPTPESVRINDPRIMTRENRAIDWTLVDVYLRAIKDSGSLALLGRRLAISRDALVKRRKELRLRPLPRGRQPSITLTPTELQVYNMVRDGLAHADIARARGVTQGGIASIVRRAEDKLQKQKKLSCDVCGGLGITACTTCHNIGPHHHICDACGGQSTTWASAGFT